jgi:hypothetical protein
VWSGPRFPADGVGPNFRGPAGVADIHNLGGKATPVDADELVLADSAAAPAFTLKKLSWANFKAAFKAWWSVETATLSNKTLDRPTIIAPSICAVTNDTVLAVNSGGAAVNFLTVFGGNAGGPVQLLAQGADPNIGLNLISQGTGHVYVNNQLDLYKASGNADAVIGCGGQAGDVVGLDVKTQSGTVKVNGVPVVTTTAAQSLSNKTLVSPTLTTPTIDSQYTAFTGPYPTLFSRKDTLALQTTGANGSIHLGMSDVNTENFLSVKGGGPTDSNVVVEASSNKSAKLVNLDLNTANGGLVKANGAPVARMVPKPAITTSAGKVGDFSVDSNYLYICWGANAWGRVPLDTAW